MFEGCFAIHGGRSLCKTVFAKGDSTTALYGRRNLALYFEDADWIFCKLCSQLSFRLRF